MTERPILFSALMVRAILAGAKTQTRRVVKPQPDHPRFKGMLSLDDEGIELFLHDRTLARAIRCPYGKPGDRLWVRENGWERPYRTPKQMREGADTWPPYEYDVEPVCCWEDGELKRLEWKRRPSIHMPRWASRITLEVTGVRVERLQDISEADAKAEGIKRGDVFPGWYRGLLPGDSAGLQQLGRDHKIPTAFPRLAYQSLWEQINGPGSWDANPWVWVVEFKKV